MEKLSFWTPVVFENQKLTQSQFLLQKMDHYFFLGGKKASVIKIDEDKNEINVILIKNTLSCQEIALKIASFFTLITPLLILIAKAILRTQFILQKTVKVIDDHPIPKAEPHNKENENLNLPPDQVKVNNCPKVTKKENEHCFKEHCFVEQAELTALNAIVSPVTQKLENENLNLPSDQPKANDLPKITKKENEHSIIEQTKKMAITTICIPAVKKLDNETPEIDYKDLKKVEAHESPKQSVAEVNILQKTQQSFPLKVIDNVPNDLNEEKVLVEDEDNDDVPNNLNEVPIVDNNEIDLNQAPVLLPAKEEHREKLQRLGIKWIDPLDNDPLFAHAHLPKKWSKKEKIYMFNKTNITLIDEKGLPRATILKNADESSIYVDILSKKSGEALLKEEKEELELENQKKRELEFVLENRFDSWTEQHSYGLFCNFDKKKLACHGFFSTQELANRAVEVLRDIVGSSLFHVYSKKLNSTDQNIKPGKNKPVLNGFIDKKWFHDNKWLGSYHWWY